MKKTPIFDDDTDNHNDKWWSLKKKKITLDPQSYRLRSSSPGAPCWQAWGSFIGNVKTLTLTLTLALSCTWLLKSSGMLLVTPKAIQRIHNTKNLKFRDICSLQEIIFQTHVCFHIHFIAL